MKRFGGVHIRWPACLSRRKAISPTQDPSGCNTLIKIDTSAELPESPYNADFIDAVFDALSKNETYQQAKATFTRIEHVELAFDWRTLTPTLYVYFRSLSNQTGREAIIELIDENQRLRVKLQDEKLQITGHHCEIPFKETLSEKPNKIGSWFTEYDEEKVANGYAKMNSTGNPTILSATTLTDSSAAQALVNQHFPQSKSLSHKPDRPSNILNIQVVSIDGEPGILITLHHNYLLWSDDLLQNGPALRKLLKEAGNQNIPVYQWEAPRNWVNHLDATPRQRLCCPR